MKSIQKNLKIITRSICKTVFYLFAAFGPYSCGQSDPSSEKLSQQIAAENIENQLPSQVEDDPQVKNKEQEVEAYREALAKAGVGSFYTQDSNGNILLNTDEAKKVVDKNSELGRLLENLGVLKKEYQVKQEEHDKLLKLKSADPKDPEKTIENEVEEKRNDLADKDNSLEHLKNEKKSFEEELEVLSIEIKQLQSSLEQIKRDEVNNIGESDIEKKIQENEKLEQELSNAKGSLDNLRSQILERKKNDKAAESKIKSDKNNKEDLEKRLQALTEEITQLGEKIDLAKKNDTKKLAEQTKSEVTDKQTKVKELESSLRLEKKEIDKLKKDLNNKQSKPEAESLATQIAKIESELSKKQEEIRKLEEEIKEILLKISETEAKVIEGERTISSKEEEVQRLNSELAKINNEIENANKSLDPKNSKQSDELQQSIEKNKKKILEKKNEKESLTAAIEALKRDIEKIKKEKEALDAKTNIKQRIEEEKHKMKLLNSEILYGKDSKVTKKQINSLSENIDAVLNSTGNTKFSKAELLYKYDKYDLKHNVLPLYYINGKSKILVIVKTQDNHISGAFSTGTIIAKAGEATKHDCKNQGLIFALGEEGSQNLPYYLDSQNNKYVTTDDEINVVFGDYNFAIKSGFAISTEKNPVLRCCLEKTSHYKLRNPRDKVYQDDMSSQLDVFLGSSRKDKEAEIASYEVFKLN